ncbi:hypothetical protein PMZ80_005410 [Knufia obscura]|uniref:Uncharacterized protein n=1 Tax=Knufia obscura TaxID=1635080 RepID=A0ABR0RRI3_9EURO|nr:hypothetical protein PMZ80_005410 [Knufia obscura]
MAIVVAKTNWASWQGLRGTQIQSTIVLEGGMITNGTWDGQQWQGGTLTDSSYGLYYHIDLSKDFDALNDDTKDYVFVPEHGERDNPNAPNFVYGAIFDNDYEFYTFGGIADKPPPAQTDTVILGKLYSSSPDNTRAAPGIDQYPQIGGNVNQSTYIAAGAYASAPDQGLGFYFGGMTGAYGGALEMLSDDTADNHPTVTTRSLIKVDMTTPDKPAFDNMHFPDDVVLRAEGALVWLPYGKKGALVAIGGTEIPGDLYLITPPRDLVSDGPFMTQLQIYDIDADVWYTQNTTGAPEQPTQTAAFCTAVVPSQDKKSQEIIVYGGYDGTYLSDTNVRDDVWILSVPAFQWTKAIDGSTSSVHGRQGSVCFAPNPSTMITVGGTTMMGSSLNTDMIVDVLDLNSMQWTHKYNASSAEAFQASQGLQKQLGWDSPNGPGDKYKTVDFLDTDDLNALFSSPYQGEVETYYPYSNGAQAGNSNGTQGGDNSTNSDNSDDNKDDTNQWKIPVIATLCSVIPVLLIAGVVLCCLRRQRKNKAGAARTQQNRGNVWSWLLGKPSQIDPSPEKSHTSEETAVERSADYFNQPGYKGANGEVYEAPSNVTSPGWGQYGHTSPGLSGVTASSPEPHEIMGQPQRESMSIRNHPYYPRSISGNHIRSVHSESISNPSELVASPGVTALQTSPSELPHDKSNENLPRAPNDMKLDQQDGEQIVSPTGMAPGSAIPRKPVGERRISGPEPSPVTPRPGHQRNQSSMSSNLPDFPSPEPEEDRRLSRQIEALPDDPRLASTHATTI